MKLLKDIRNLFRWNWFAAFDQKSKLKLPSNWGRTARSWRLDLIHRDWHSHSACRRDFYRAGGFARVIPDSWSWLECLQKMAQKVRKGKSESRDMQAELLAEYQNKLSRCLLISSNSGETQYLIENGPAFAKAAGAKVSALPISNMSKGGEFETLVGVWIVKIVSDLYLDIILERMGDASKLN